MYDSVGMSTPSLYRESTDSLIVVAIFILPTASKDYEYVTTEMVFEGGLTHVCTSIAIYDDNQVEWNHGPNTEMFTISLESGVGRNAVILSTANIYIIDNDGMSLYCV